MKALKVLKKSNPLPSCDFALTLVTSSLFAPLTIPRYTTVVQKNDVFRITNHVPKTYETETARHEAARQTL